MVTFLGKNINPLYPYTHWNHPPMTLLGCFTVLMMYLESYLETPESLRTNLYPLRTSREVLSLLNITFLQFAIVQCLYILQNSILFLIMTLINRGFLGNRRHGIFWSFCGRCWIVLTDTSWRIYACFFSRMQLLMKGTSSPHVVYVLQFWLWYSSWLQLPLF